MSKKYTPSEFIVSGDYNEYKHVMIKAVMAKIGENVQKKLKRLKLEFRDDFTFGTNVPIYDFDNTCILINKEEVIRSKKRIRVYPFCNCYPQELEFKLYNVLKRQRHLHWFIRLCYHEYDINTRSFENFPPRRNTVGLGALLVKWGVDDNIRMDSSSPRVNRCNIERINSGYQNI